MSSADHIVSNSALLGSVGEQPGQQLEPKSSSIQEMKAAKPAIHPFFDTQKRNELRHLPPKGKGSRPITPASISADEAEVKPKKSRARSDSKPQKPTKSRETKRRKKGAIEAGPSNPTGDANAIASFSGPTSSLITPASSPGPSEDAIGGYEIDPNRNRRKRRKKTPIPLGGDQDGTSEEHSCGLPSAPQEKFNNALGNPEVCSSWDGRILTIRAPDERLAKLSSAAGDKSQELFPASASNCLVEQGRGGGKTSDVASLSAPDDQTKPRRGVSYNPNTGIIVIPRSPFVPLNTPVPVPSLPLPELDLPHSTIHQHDEVPLSALEEAVQKNKRVVYDYETGALMIQSSPLFVPESPAMPPVNAFSLMGKKKDPPQLDINSPILETCTRPTPAVTIRDVPRRTAASLGTKPVHPFFKPGGMKKPDNAPTTTTLVANTTSGDGTDRSKSISLEPQDQPQGSSCLFDNNQTHLPSGPGARAPISYFNSVNSRSLGNSGAVGPPWPSKDNCHVRGLSEEGAIVHMVEGELVLKERKLKDAVVAIPPEEDILGLYTSHLGVNAQKEDMLSADYHERRFYEVPSDVRLPKRVVTTGVKFKEAIRERVSARLPHPNNSAVEVPRGRENSVSSISSEGPTRQPHQALLNLYDRLGRELSAFDKCECESQAWETKYAPTSSSEVLQIGKEPRILKDWLMALKVENMGTGSNNPKLGAKRKQKHNLGAAGKAATKRKKKCKKDDDELAGFIIDSEEEMDEMDEITDPEDTDYSTIPGAKKSTMRAGDKGIDSPFGGLREPDRLVNAVVISGPSGCGKTAAIYAVAKEVGFAIFEVSPGAKRSGKEILDLVGEMTRNHLVQKAKAGTPASATSFFKSKMEKNTQVGEDVQLNKSQQSLLLLEEVDLLFDEDKQFWSTVLSLIAQSKRPVVMTCNDESLLPIDLLSLHAVLRLTPPPTDLIVDHLLLICANEGHMLRREAIMALVNATGRDLRASLMELEFWCRMGVGDRKGGLDWVLVRWPNGSDRDEDGNVLRVISRNTYRKGMDWIQRGAGDEEKWNGVWEKWGVDVGSGEDRELRDFSAGLGKDLQSLEMWDDYAEAMSSVDMCAGLGMDSTEAALDTTLPLIGAKVRLDDIVGYQTLQTDPVATLWSIETNISICVRSLARIHLNDRATTLSISPLNAIRDEEIIGAVADRRNIKDRLSPLSDIYIREVFQSLGSTSTIFSPTPSISHSVITGPRVVLMTDAAPYIRGITKYDLAREEKRKRTSGLLSQGGRSRKRRLTRAARVAEEGGDRSRRERWFGQLNARLVEGSGGDGWGDTAISLSREASESEEDNGRTS